LGRLQHELPSLVCNPFVIPTDAEQAAKYIRPA